MPAPSDDPSSFAQPKEPSRWPYSRQEGSYGMSDPNRLPTIEPLRPVEPTSAHHVSRPFLPARVTEGDPGQQRQQLPSVQELLTPSARPETRSSFSSWSSVNSSSTHWPDTTTRHASTSQLSQPSPASYVPLQPPVHPSHSIGAPAEMYRSPARQPSFAAVGAPRPSLPIPSLAPNEVADARLREQMRRASQYGDPFSASLMPPGFGSFSETYHDRNLERRPSLANLGRPSISATPYGSQCVGQRSIPGEGLCYVFKDGSTCPTVIDGEPVNPLWGTTKAGKARKRLAQACLNCREKKIKCEPGDTSCVQCEKAKRECHRPANQQTQAEMATGLTLSRQKMSPSRGDWSSQASTSSVAMTEIQAQKRRRSAQTAQQESIVSQYRSQGESSRDGSPHSGVKRRRSEQTSSPAPDTYEERQRKDSKRTFDDDECIASNHLDTSNHMSWDEDPFRIEPEASLRFLELFFTQSAREVRILFPKRAFIHWAIECKEKCQRECMVLYSILALGSLFSKEEYISFGKLCGDRASQAVTSLFGRFSVALVQARLILSVYNQLKGKDNMAWDLSGSALRAASAMKLNTEEGCGDGIYEYSRPYYSFSCEQLRECRRRTFWTVFLQDRYNGFCGGSLFMLQAEDINLRLPCVEQTYEDGTPSQAPFYKDFMNDTTNTSEPVAQTICIASLWQRVVEFTYRSSRNHSTTYAQSYESFYEDCQKASTNWTNHLPPHLQYSQKNLLASLQTGQIGNFLVMHVLHHMSQLKAARMIYHRLLPARVITRSIRAANLHASQLLKVVCDVGLAKTQFSGNSTGVADLMSPFIAFSITFAIDTLGAGGPIEDLAIITTTLSSAVAILQDISQFCMPAKSQAKKAETRLAQIEAVSSHTNGHRNFSRDEDDRSWGVADPMELHFPLAQDVVYGVPASTLTASLLEGRDL